MRMLRNRIQWAGPIAGLAWLLAAPAPRAQLAAQERPAGVSDSTIQVGAQLYQSSGDCVRCHGTVGEGTPDGESLISGQWKRGDGSYPWLVKMVEHAAVGARSRGGDPAPMRGPGTLDSAQVAAVAAYVWSISRSRQPPAK